MSDIHHGNGRFRHVAGPDSSKAGYKDYTFVPTLVASASSPSLKAYCTCPGGSAGAWASPPYLVTGHPLPVTPTGHPLNG